MTHVVGEVEVVVGDHSAGPASPRAWTPAAACATPSGRRARRPRQGDPVRCLVEHYEQGHDRPHRGLGVAFEQEDVDEYDVLQWSK
jgi:hypothetical protein